MERPFEVILGEADGVAGVASTGAGADAGAGTQVGKGGDENGGGGGDMHGIFRRS